MADAEFAGLRRAGRDVRVPGQFRTRVQGQGEPALQLEHHNCSGRVGVVTGELCADDTRRLQSQSGVELKSPLEIRYCQRDDMVRYSKHLTEAHLGRGVTF
jgi:hypothetical protein